MLLAVRTSSYGCTWEVWRALKKLSQAPCLPCQAPKHCPKWRRPMMKFLLFWSGISLGSDALWKLKQQSVTQLSVVFLLVSTKNKHFLE